MTENATEATESKGHVNSISFLPTVPHSKPKTFEFHMASFVGELNEKMLSLDEYRRVDVEDTPQKAKKVQIQYIKKKKNDRSYASRYKKINTKSSITNYLSSIGKNNSAKKAVIQNPYLAKLLKKENIDTSSFIETCPNVESVSELPSISEPQKNLMSDIPPIKQTQYNKNMNFVSTTTLDQLLGDTSHIFLSQIPIHGKINHQLRQLDYENNKVNTLLRSEKNHITRLDTKMNRKFKAFHWKYLMTDNEKDLRPETNFEVNEDTQFEGTSLNMQLARMINCLKAVHEEEAKDIIKANYHKEIQTEMMIMKRTKEETRKRKIIHNLLEKSEKTIKKIKQKKLMII